MHWAFLVVLAFRKTIASSGLARLQRADQLQFSFLFQWDASLAHQALCPVVLGLVQGSIIEFLMSPNGVAWALALVLVQIARRVTFVDARVANDFAGLVEMVMPGCCDRPLQAEHRACRLSLKKWLASLAENID